MHQSNRPKGGRSRKRSEAREGAGDSAAADRGADLKSSVNSSISTRVSSRPATDFPRSTRKGPHWTASRHARFWGNSVARKISTVPSRAASTPLSRRAFRKGAIVFPALIKRPTGAPSGSK